MKDQQKDVLPIATSSHHPRFARILVVCLLLMVVVALGGWSGNLFSTSSADAAAVSQTTTSVPIKVFFSKFPVSVDTNFSAVFPVNRVSPTSAVGTFAIQLLIAGPTVNERNAGYFTELNSMLSGPSSCSAPHPIGGPDFTLTLNKKGTQNETGTATLKFCRTLTSSGVGADGRVQAQINATLKQFSSIKKVVILTKDGHCFADGSGRDQCLH